MRARLAAVGMSVVAALLLVGVPVAGAATISVSTRSDEVSPTDGSCSLREAVAAANTSKSSGGAAGECPAGDAGSNMIMLPGGAPYVLTLAGGGALQIKSALTIVGAGTASTKVDGGGVDRVLDVGTAVASVTGVTITGGHAPDGTASVLGGGSGGGIRNAGVLTLTDVSLLANRAGDAATSPSGALGAAGGSGGGIYNSGTLFLVRATVAKNDAGHGGTGGFHIPPGHPGMGGPGGSGGGVFNAAGATLNATDSSITGNHGGVGGTGGDTGFGGSLDGAVGGFGGAGGGLWNAGTLSLTTSAVTGNVAGRGGNGGFNREIGSTSGGGPGGTGGLGGGVFDDSAVSQTIANSTIAANFAGAGGDGILGGYGGDGGGGGGVVSANAALGLVSVTVSANQVGAGGGDGGGGPGGSGGGGGISAFGSVTLQNTIVAGNGGGNCLGATTDGGHNLSFPDTTCPGINSDPKLGAPSDNGGPTATAALGPGSAAIDQVPASGAGCPATDARGVPRPQGLACDIGAFELGQTPLNTGLPVMSGSPAVGQTLTCSNGTWSNPPFTYAYAWLRDGVAIAGASSPSDTMTVADTGHSVRCRVTATNSFASASADSAAVTIPGGRGSVKAPAVSGLGISPHAFVAAASGPSATTATTETTAIAHKHPKPQPGARVSYRLNIAATVRFSVKQELAGRTVGNGRKAHCMPATHGNRQAHKCTRVITLRGSFVRAGKAGASSFRFTGRLNGHKLTPGNYMLVAKPNAGGETGPPIAITFRIVG